MRNSYSNPDPSPNLGVSVVWIDTGGRDLTLDDITILTLSRNSSLTLNPNPNWIGGTKEGTLPT